MGSRTWKPGPGFPGEGGKNRERLVKGCNFSVIW